jgi:hypothetical protein
VDLPNAVKHELRGLSLRGTWVRPVGVPLADAAVAPEDEELALLPSCEVACGGARLCLCRVRGACSARAFNLNAPARVGWDYVNVTLCHVASVPARPRPKSPTPRIHREISVRQRRRSFRCPECQVQHLRERKR